MQLRLDEFSHTKRAGRDADLGGNDVWAAS